MQISKLKTLVLVFLLAGSLLACETLEESKDNGPDNQRQGPSHQAYARTQNTRVDSSAFNDHFAQVDNPYFYDLDSGSASYAYGGYLVAEGTDGPRNTLGELCVDGNLDLTEVQRYQDGSLVDLKLSLYQLDTKDLVYRSSCYLYVQEDKIYRLDPESVDHGQKPLLREEDLVMALEDQVILKTKNIVSQIVTDDHGIAYAYEDKDGPGSKLYIWNEGKGMTYISDNDMDGQYVFRLFSKAFDVEKTLHKLITNNQYHSYLEEPVDFNDFLKNHKLVYKDENPYKSQEGLKVIDAYQIDMNGDGNRDLLVLEHHKSGLEIKTRLYENMSGAYTETVLYDGGHKPLIYQGKVYFMAPKVNPSNLAYAGFDLSVYREGGFIGLANMDWSYYYDLDHKPIFDKIFSKSYLDQADSYLDFETNIGHLDQEKDRFKMSLGKTVYSFKVDFVETSTGGFPSSWFVEAQANTQNIKGVDDFLDIKGTCYGLGFKELISGQVVAWTISGGDHSSISRMDLKVYEVTEEGMVLLEDVDLMGQVKSLYDYHYNIVDRLGEDMIYFRGETWIKTPVILHKAKTVAEFVPKNWRVHSSLELDFNQDGYMDHVMVLDHQDSNESHASVIKAPRLLVILENVLGQGYELSLLDDHILSYAHEGGTGSDPFMGLSAIDHKLLLSELSGTAWQTKRDYTFEYKNKQWVASNLRTINSWEEILTSSYDYDYSKNSLVYFNFNHDDYEMVMSRDPDMLTDFTMELTLEGPISLKAFSQANHMRKYRPYRLPIGTVLYDDSIEDGISQEAMVDWILNRSRDVYFHQDYLVHQFYDHTDQGLYLALYDKDLHQTLLLDHLPEGNERLGDIMIFKDTLFYSLDTYDRHDVLETRLYKVDLSSKKKELIFTLKNKRLDQGLGRQDIDLYDAGRKVLIKTQSSQVIEFYLYDLEKDLMFPVGDIQPYETNNSDH